MSSAGEGGSRRFAASAFDSRTPYRVLEREHTSLRQSLAQLHAAFHAESPSDAGSGELSRQVRAVRASLAAHFAFEEDFGSLHHLVAARPGLQPQLEEMYDDHREILRVFDRLLAGLAAGRTVADAVAPWSSLLDRLAEHELKQHQLVRRALLKLDAAPPLGSTPSPSRRLRAAS